MWPAAFLILAVAITEAYRHLSYNDSDEPKPKEVWNVRSGVEGYEDLVGTMEKVGFGWGFTIGLEALAVGLVALGWFLWPGEAGGEVVENDKEE
jgi:hypothetical protein